MPAPDRIQQALEALVALWNGDTNLRTMFGRTTNLVRPWNAAVLDGPLPVLVYAPISETAADFATRRLTIQVSCFASSRATASAAIAQAVASVTNPNLTARGLDACLAPDSPPLRTWLDPDASPDDPATARADVTLTLLLAA